MLAFEKSKCYTKHKSNTRSSFFVFFGGLKYGIRIFSEQEYTP